MVPLSSPPQPGSSLLQGPAAFRTLLVLATPSLKAEGVPAREQWSEAVPSQLLFQALHPELLHQHKIL